MIKFYCFGLWVTALFFLQNCQSSQDFHIDRQNPGAVWLSPDEPEYVGLAVRDLLEDIAKITGGKMELVTDFEECSGDCIAIGTIGSDGIAALLSKDRLDSLQGQWERYAVQQSGSRIVIAGSNARGTMFGIYHFLEQYLGVDPLHFWTDYEPDKLDDIRLKEIDYLSPEPDFRFRGWFINDEDLLTEWKEGGGIRTIDYPYYGQVVTPEVIRKVVEAAVRLRYNLIIPASFVDIRNPPEERLVAEASRRGLYVSMHHIEPMGVSAFGYQNFWKEKGEEPLFSFYSEPEKLKETWRHYAERWATYPDVIWQIGLRGIADRPMWLADPGVPQSDADRGRIISEAMFAQKQIIREVTGEEDPLMTTTLWAEGAYFNEKGFLQIPEGVMVIFADNSPGWVWQPDFYDTERETDRLYGVYYHHQLWGSGPHLVQAVPPAKTYELFTEARKRNSDEYAIMNVSNIREFPLALEASTAMLWDMDDFDPAAFLDEWCARRFPAAPKATVAAYQKFFESYQLVGEKKIPGFLDGQQRIRGLSLLRQLKEQIEDINRFRSRQKAEAAKKRPADAFRKSLSDTNPAGAMPLAKAIPILERQLADLATSRELAEVASAQLEGRQQAFFQTNLEAQIQIQVGLGQWLHALMQARLMMDNEDAAKAGLFLQEALQAFETIRAGQELATRGKWKDWYRGDKKMNLQNLEEQTGNINTLIRSEK